MSVDTKNIPLATGIQGTMSNTTKKFIGAVEDEWQLYSDEAKDYTIGSPIGFGASSIVYAATYSPPSDDSSSNQTSLTRIPCALKVLDLDSLPPRSLQLLQRETTLMSLSKHPNVLRVRGSWMDGHKLYIALRLMNKGSAADVMRYGWPGGMEEDVVRCILRQALKGLNYLHINGFIHRDIKAANLLIDDDGTVLLGDLGVAADLTEDTSNFHTSTSHINKFSITSASAMAQSECSTSVRSSSSGGKRAVAFNDTVTSRPRMGKRKSFVGTPCWMAPELIQGRQYDSSADIWSFGITALELTQGRPPRSRESPQHVLLRTVQDDPPTLEREGAAFKYSRAFKEVVDSCLNKDPTQRPTADELLQTPFFKAAKKKSYLINTILKDLPPLVQRQERRVVSPIKSSSSVDSWDFAITMNSPTTSIYRRRVLEDLVAAEDEEARQVAVIPMEGNHSTSTHSTRKWSDLTVPAIEEAGSEKEVIAPASPSTSVSSLPSSGMDDGLSDLPNNSAPSSYTDTSELACRVQSAQLSRPETSSSSPVEEHPSHLTITGHNKGLGQSVSVPHKLASSVGPQPASSPGPSGQKGLWKKFKTNVKRGALSDSENPDNSPRKEKGKRTSVFGTASKVLLSRSSTTQSLAQSLKDTDP